MITLSAMLWHQEKNRLAVRPNPIPKWKLKEGWCQEGRSDLCRRNWCPDDPCTMVQINQESRHKYWATRLFVCLFARTAHSLSSSRESKRSDVSKQPGFVPQYSATETGPRHVNADASMATNTAATSAAKNGRGMASMGDGS